MATLSTSFTAVGAGGALAVRKGDKFTYSVSGTFSGTVVLEKSQDLLAWEIISSHTAAASGTIEVEATAASSLSYRFRCSAYTSGTIETSIADAAKTLVKYANNEGTTIFEVTEASCTMAAVATVTTTGTNPATTGVIRMANAESIAWRNSGNTANRTLTVDSGNDLVYSGATAGSTLTMGPTHTDNTNAASHARVRVTSGGASGGDAYVDLIVSGATQWSAGVDNSDSDAFVISNGAPGTNNRLKITTAGAVSIPGSLLVTGALTRTAQKRVINTGAKVGGTAGWTVGAPDDLGMLATCAAGGTAATLVVPISGLKVGDTITAFHLIGQIESGGNTATVDADLRMLTAAAADVTDASVGAITQVSVTADTILSAANSEKAALTQAVGADTTFYVLITATTAASTDIALQGVAITVTEA